MNIFESFADIVNNGLGGLEKPITQYWLYLLAFPLIVLVAIVTKYFGLW